MSIPAFQSLNSQDQQLLLEESVIELLILTALQYKGTSSADSIFLVFQQNCGSLSESYKLKDIIKYIETLQLDQFEFTCLKALLLFRPGEFPWPSYHWNWINAQFDQFFSSLRWKIRIWRTDGHSSGWFNARSGTAPSLWAYKYKHSNHITSSIWPSFAVALCHEES